MEYDMAFSVGPRCRPAYYLEKYGLRSYAYPLDWLVCSLDTTVHLHKTQFSDFLESYKNYPKKARPEKNTRYVLDDKNHIRFLHHIMLDKDLEDEIVRVRELMKKRYLRQKEHIEKSKNILMVGNHNIRRERLEAFLVEMGEIYPNKHFTLLNVHFRKNGKNVYTYNISDKLTLIEYHANDYEPLDVEKPWQGNPEVWKKIIPNIRVKNEF